jgi:RNA polymerase sigma-70 factor (ECF subfamily)
MLDISALIERWQAGDERAAETLYNHYQGQVFRLAHGILGDAADAEEVAQDALTYALTKINRYDPERASFSTWLHTITVSRCRDRQRRRRLHSLPLASWLNQGGDLRDATPGQERQAVQAAIRGEVWNAVQALSPPLREAILLRYWAGHTYREMAGILSCSISTAQSRVCLAYQRLRVALAPDHLADLDDGGEEPAR